MKNKIQRYTVYIVGNVQDGQRFDRFSQAVDHCENKVNEFVRKAMPMSSTKEHFVATEYILNHREELCELLQFSIGKGVTLGTVNLLLPRWCNMTGSRIFVDGATVSEVKRAVGTLAKKVRASSACVEVIHTHNGTGPQIRGRRRPGLYQLHIALEHFAWRNA